MRCRMPRSGVPFELVQEHDRWLEARPYTFTLITIAGANLTVHVMAVDDRGAIVPFRE